MVRSATLLGLAIVAAIAGCAQPGSVAIRTSTAALTTNNGISLNGVSLNGVSLNGVSLNGVSLNGVSLNGVSLNGLSLNGVSLNGSGLVGVQGNTTLSGTAMNYARFSGTLSNGRALPLKVKGVRHSSGVWFYELQYLSDSGWENLCGGGEAIALEGRWNYDLGTSGGGSWINDASSFTFACRGANLAKCVEIGYQPWATGSSGVSLRDHHQACVRMMRADYCGNGTSYTVDGTAINLYDNEGIQSDTESWDKEAEWTADGARCVRDDSERGGYTPYCVRSLPKCSGSTYWSQGALLVSECHNCDRD